MEEMKRKKKKKKKEMKRMRRIHGCWPGCLGRKPHIFTPTVQVSCVSYLICTKLDLLYSVYSSQQDLDSTPVYLLYIYIFP